MGALEISEDKKKNRRQGTEDLYHHRNTGISSVIQDHLHYVVMIANLQIQSCRGHAFNRILEITFPNYLRQDKNNDN